MLLINHTRVRLESLHMLIYYNKFCMLVGGMLVALKVMLCGRWSLCAFCAVYGGNGMINILRAAKGLRKD